MRVFGDIFRVVVVGESAVKERGVGNDGAEDQGQAEEAEPAVVSKMFCHSKSCGYRKEGGGAIEEAGRKGTLRDKGFGKALMFVGRLTAHGVGFHLVVIGGGEFGELFDEGGHGPDFFVGVGGTPAGHGAEFDAVLGDPKQLGRGPIGSGHGQIRSGGPEALGDFAGRFAGRAVAFDAHFIKMLEALLNHRRVVQLRDPDAAGVMLDGAGRAGGQPPIDEPAVVIGGADVVRAAENEDEQGQRLNHEDDDDGQDYLFHGSRFDFRQGFDLFMPRYNGNHGRLMRYKPHPECGVGRGLPPKGTKSAKKETAARIGGQTSPSIFPFLCFLCFFVAVPVHPIRIPNPVPSGTTK